MKLHYDSLTIKLDYEVIDIAELKLTEAINEHGLLEISFRCEKIKAEEIIQRSSSDDTISVYDGEKCIFQGMLSEMELKKDQFCAYLATRWTSFTAKLDIAQKSRAYTGDSMQYTDIISAIASKNEGMFCKENSGKEKIPGFILQYKETDWQFLKRLAGKNSCVLIPDSRMPYACFQFGLPQNKSIKIEDTHGVKCTTINYEEYAKREEECMLTAFLQDCYCFQVKSKAWYELGQRVEYEGKEGVIQRVTVWGNRSLVEKCYDIVPEAGVKRHTGIHNDFSGLHLPATVKEVTGTKIRADFEIEQITKGEERYFEYAVESSAWYCMPEQGSSVHIYLPENDETKAYTVHSMRNTESGGKHAQATSDPQVKSYTHPSGSAMQLDGGQLLLTADGSGNTQASLGSDGTLGLKAKKITIYTAGNIRIGKSQHSENRAGAPAKDVSVSSSMDISVITGKGAYAYLGEQAFLKGNLITNLASIHDAVEIPAEILSRNDGIEDVINEMNATAKAVELQKVQEAKQKTGMGLFAMAAGAVAIAAVCVCTCGAGLVAVAAVAGTVAITCGASMAVEGVQDYQKAVETGDFSKSYNFMRDSVLGGNQMLYDILTYGSVLICGIVVGVATGGGGLEALKTVLVRAGTEMGLDTAINLVMDYIDDGSINNGWESYFKSMCMTGCTSGISMGIMNKFKDLEKAKKLSCSQLSKLRLGVDVTLDSLVSFATTGEVDPIKIVLRNYLANKLTLADPVDGATGSLYIPAVDMKLPDIREDFTISRKYESVNPRSGLLGPGWTCSLESRLQYTAEQCYILCPDGHVESFYLREDGWHNDKGDSRRMELREGEEGYRLLDVPNHMSYIYAKDNGRIMYAEDGQKNRSVYEYSIAKNINSIGESNGETGILTLTAVTTFGGSRIQIQVEQGRLTKLTDVLGRTVTYTYDESGYLVCINQNDRGLTRYVYDRKGNITEITDQNNKRYTINTFDGKGRVVQQHYPDGSSCEISYNDSERSAVFYYPETGGRQKVYHNPEHLVTRIEYQDDTYEAYDYDQWQNKIYYRDRNGNETHWEYSAYGEKIREVQPGGLEIQSRYKEPGYLSEEKDNEGGCTRYIYDSHHNLAEKSTLISGAYSGNIGATAEKSMPIAAEAGNWSRECYGYDRFGRIHYKEDANGNRTSYYYKKEEPEKLTVEDIYPEIEVTPEGYEYFYTYDKAGRKTKAEAEGTSMEFSYNGLHHINQVTDGEGNIIHEEYDNLGSLIRRYNHRQWMRSRNGGGYTYEYDYLDRLIRVKDPLGREKYFKRNGQGSILYESLLCKPQRIPEQEETAGLYSTYDANDNRTSITCPDGGRWESRYDSEGNLLYEGSPTEQGGKYYTYDAMNRITEIRLEDGTVTNSYIYDRKGRLIQETNALGEVTYYAYDKAGRKTGVWEYAGESTGIARKIKEDYPEKYGSNTQNLESSYRVTQYLYDNAGNVIEERKGLEAVKPLEYPHRFLSIHKKYDKQNRLISVEDGTGAKVTYAYDFRNNRTRETQLINAQGVERKVSYTYDRAGRLIKKEELCSSKENGRSSDRNGITQYGYDEAGNLTFIQLPEGGTIRTIYDAADRLVCTLEQDKKNGICRSRNYRYEEVCALAWEQLYGREDYAKRLNQQLMNCNTLEDYQSDEFAEILSKEQPSEIRYYSGKKALAIHHAYEQIYENARVWEYKAEEKLEAGKEGEDYFTRRYSYDFRGNLLSYEDTLDNQTSYTYNQTGDLLRVIAPDGSETTFAYDAQGRLLSKTNGEQEREYLLAYDKLDRVIAETDGEGNTISYIYHSSGEISKVTGADGNTDQQTAYDIWGRPDSVTDGNGNTTIYQKDIWGRVTKVIYPDGGEEHYAYDYAGNIIQAREAVGNETEFCYNEGSRLKSIQKADGNKRYFGYDREGRCVYRKDENGNIIRLSYNMDSNPVLSTGSRCENEISETAGSRNITSKPTEAEIRSLYVYDEQGFLVQASEGGSVYHYERDSEGNTLRKSAWGRTLYEAAYDACGRITRLDGTRYQYDKAGRLQQAESEQGIRAAYRYNKNGMQKEVVCGNGLRTTYEYDSRNQLISLNAGFDGKEPLLQAVYHYDGNGNRTGKKEQLQRKSGTQREVEHTTYCYDKMNRLTGESRNGSETSYSYDLAGNRTSRIQAGNKEIYRYNSRNQLTELISDNNNIRYSYDFAGNLVEENHCSATAGSSKIKYIYDSYNRNTEVKGNNFRQKNSYDAEGYRCRLEENEKVTNFVYRAGMLLGEKSEENELKQSYVLGNEYIGLISKTEKESTARYYVTDEQGSIRYVLHGNGEVESYYQYDAFGEMVTQEGIQSRLQYNSQIWDELSGLYYLRARYYNPRTGRFTQEDVIYDDGLNLYAYCNSNPVIYSDPSGFAKANAKEDLPNRKQAFNKAKDRAGVPRSQQPNRQWRVGKDINMKGHDAANYKYDPSPGSHGRYYEYDTPNGKRVIVEHTNDGAAHFHAGKPKGNPNSHTYDFKTDRYQKIDGSDGDHHICYKK